MADQISELDQIVEVLRLLTKDVAEIRRGVASLWLVAMSCLLAIAVLILVVIRHG